MDSETKKSQFSRLFLVGFFLIRVLSVLKIRVVERLFFDFALLFS